MRARVAPRSTLPAPSASEPPGMRLFASVKAPTRYHREKPGPGVGSGFFFLSKREPQAPIHPEFALGVRLLTSQLASDTSRESAICRNWE